MLGAARHPGERGPGTGPDRCSARRTILGSFKSAGSSVAPRESHSTIHRPPRPAPSRSRRWASWPATCAGPGTPRPRTSSRPSTPTPGQASGHDPVRLLGCRRRRPGSTSWRRTRAFLRRLSGCRADLEQYLTGDRWYQRRDAPGDAAAARDRLLLPGVRHHRRAPAVLRRSRHPGRRPPQDRQRPGRPDHRCRPALPARATSASRCPATAGSRRPTRSSTPTACRSRCCARPTARSPRSRSACPARATTTRR